MNTPANAVISLRRELHRYPEISGHETETAGRILKFFEALNPDTVMTGLGGTGLAFVFAGARLGPTVMLRSEMENPRGMPALIPSAHGPPLFAPILPV